MKTNRDLICSAICDAKDEDITNNYFKQFRNEMA